MAKRWLPRATFAFLTGVGLAACNALTGIGDLALDDGAPDGAPESSLVDGRRDDVTGPGPADGGSDADDPDASIFADVDATVVDGCSPQGCFTLPLGFQLVAFGPSGGSCPENFGTPTEVVGDTTASSAACACGCSITAQPSCPDQGAKIITATFVTNLEGGAPVCGNNSGEISGGCTADGFLGPFNAGTTARRYVPPSGGPTGGTCNATANKDITKLTSTKSRICQATVIPQCGSQVCPPAVAAPFKACIAAAGVATCPAEFPNGKTVGTKADFTCEGSCGCNVTGNCSGGVLNFYDNPSCAGVVDISFTVNGQCQITPQPGGGPYLSHRYIANPPTGVACNKTGTSSPSAVQLTQVTTVCCN